MENREAGLTELYERLRENKDILGLSSFIKTPTKPVLETQMPCVVMSEGVDTILDYSQRNRHGYPAKRALEVSFELITGRSTDIKALYIAVRRTLFLERGHEAGVIVINPNIAEGVFINEKYTEGPLGYGLPDVLGMKLVLDLVYTDNGF